MTLDILKLDARRNCYPAKDYILIENWDGSPISSPVCTIIRRNPIKAMSQNAICIKFVTNNKVNSTFLFNFFTFDTDFDLFGIGAIIFN